MRRLMLLLVFLVPFVGLSPEPLVSADETMSLTLYVYEGGGHGQVGRSVAGPDMVLFPKGAYEPEQMFVWSSCNYTWLPLGGALVKDENRVYWGESDTGLPLVWVMATSPEAYSELISVLKPGTRMTMYTTACVSGSWRVWHVTVDAPGS